MSLPGSSTLAADDPAKADSAAASAAALMSASAPTGDRATSSPGEAFENAVALVMAVGGSTNAVLHFLAIAHAAEVEWSLDDFERVRRRVPVICDLKPSGVAWATDLDRCRRHPAGHEAAARPRPARRRMRRPSTADVSARRCRTYRHSRVPISRSFAPSPTRCMPEGHLAILRGNLRRRRLRGQDQRSEETLDHRSGAGLRFRGGARRRRSSPIASDPATSSLFVMKVRRAVLACARCWRRPRPSSVKASASRWR